MICLLALSIGLSSRPPSASAAAIPQVNSLTSPILQSLILSDGWPIRKVVAIPTGDLVFAGGDFLDGADRLVLVKSDRTVKIAASGDPVPGNPGHVLATVGIMDVRSTVDYGDFSLNALGEVAFSAIVVRCSGISDVRQCAASSTPFEGLFLFSERSKHTIALQWEPAPGVNGGIFKTFERVFLNSSGMIVFRARVALPGGTEAIGLFSFSQGRIEKVVISGEAIPAGPVYLYPEQSAFLNDDGMLTFMAYDSNGYDSIFRFQDGVLSRKPAPNDPAPGGGVFGSMIEADANDRGDVVVRSEFSSSSNERLYVHEIDGGASLIAAHGDLTPTGGQYRFFALVGMGSFRTYRHFSLVPEVNNSREVLFASPITGATARAGVFLARHGQISKVAADGDRVPEDPGTSVFFDYSVGKPSTEFHLNNLGMAVFSANKFSPAGLSTLFLYANGYFFKVMSPMDAAPGTDSGSFAQLKWFSLDDNGEVAFHATLCCGKFKEGIFLASLQHAGIPNGDFENPGDGGLPANWQLAWNNSGSGEIFRYSGSGTDSFDGKSLLRLHVRPGGGSTFILSDPIPILADNRYLIAGQMRYYLTAASDTVYFSVIQYDAAGHEVGLDEVEGSKADSYWTWTPRGVLIQTTPTAASIRVRFGLASSSESYLDVDAVR